MGSSKVDSVNSCKGLFTNYVTKRGVMIGQTFISHDKGGSSVMQMGLGVEKGEGSGLKNIFCCTVKKVGQKVKSDIS